MGLITKTKDTSPSTKKNQGVLYNRVKNQVRNGGWRVGWVPFYFLLFIVLMMGERWGGGCGFIVFSFSFGDLEGGREGRWVEFFFLDRPPTIPHFILKI